MARSPGRRGGATPGTMTSKEQPPWHGASCLRPFALDWQAPLSAFSSADPGAPPPINESTSMRLLYATGACHKYFHKDFMSGAEIDFTNVATITLGEIENGRYGVLYDTRDTPPEEMMEPGIEMKQST